MKFEVVFWLAILAVWFFQALAGKKKREAKKNLPAPAEQGPAGSDFKSALDEISKILQGETQPDGPDFSIPLPHHAEEAASAPGAPSVSAPSTTERPVLIERHDFRKRTREPSAFYDESFEQKSGSTFHAPDIVHDHDYDYSAFKKEEKKAKSELGSMVNHDLHDKAKTREAFVLSELLGPPLSKKKGSGYR